MIYECFTVNLYLYFFFSICYIWLANLYNSLNDDYIRQKEYTNKMELLAVSQSIRIKEMTREVKTLKGEPYSDDDDDIGDIVDSYYIPKRSRWVMKD